MTTEASIIIVVALLAGSVGTYVIMRYFQARERETENLLRRIGDLEKAEAERRERIGEVKATKKHHTYSVIAGLEDAMSLLIHEELEDEARAARRRTAMGILQTLREGPHAYDPDRPNGRK